jgi:hypothetical protein
MQPVVGQNYKLSIKGLGLRYRASAPVNAASSLWPCQKCHLKACSTEHAKDLRPIAEVKRNPGDGLNMLNLYRFYQTRSYPLQPIDVGDAADSPPGSPRIR